MRGNSGERIQFWFGLYAFQRLICFAGLESQVHFKCSFQCMNYFLFLSCMLLVSENRIFLMMLIEFPHTNMMLLLIFVQISDIEGDGYAVRRGWKIMVITLIRMKINHQGLQILLLAQRSRVRKVSLLTTVCVFIFPLNHVFSHRGLIRIFHPELNYQSTFFFFFFFNLEIGLQFGTNRLKITKTSCFHTL